MAQEPRKEPNLSMNPRVEHDRKMILDAKAKGRGATAGAFVRLSGPGWLQSAITLGGGSLSSSLYLGVLGGFMFLWLQPLAMAAGIIMLSAIAYVTLSTGERPLRAINRHVSPVLGWGWLIASMMANLVWSLPQFALATASFQQNLFPGIFGMDAAIPSPWNKVAVGFIILCITLTMGTVYSIGGKGVKVFEVVVKCLVGVTVVCFIGVVVTLTLKGQLAWGAIASGFIPRLNLLFEPVDAFQQYIAQVPEQFQDFWRDHIVGQQRDVMIAAAATAVGINMTFLFPYSMLRKGWDRDFRELAIFDLSTGLFFPFLMATSCVVIAAASQFNAVPAQGFIALEGQSLNAEEQVLDAQGNVIEPAGNLVGGYHALLRDRITKTEGPAAFYGGLTPEAQESARNRALRLREAASPEAVFSTGDSDPFAAGLTAESMAALCADEKFAALTPDAKKLILDCLAPELPRADQMMAAMMVKRDAFNLKDALTPLVGDKFSRYVFGLGVLGMAMGAATMLMLINGLCFCEMLNLPAKGWPQRIGMAMVSVGILGPFFWGDAKMWLAMPTSVFAMTLLPLAYLSFFFLMNQKKFLGESMPKGKARWVWNILMAISAGLAVVASVCSLWIKLQGIGIALIVGFSILTIAVHYLRPAHQD